MREISLLKMTIVTIDGQQRSPCRTAQGCTGLPFMSHRFISEALQQEQGAGEQSG